MKSGPWSALTEGRKTLLLGVSVFLFAFLVRLVGIGWGLPTREHWVSLHPDEFVVWSAAQQIEPAKLDFDPGFYNYGTLYLSLLKVAGTVRAAYAGQPAADDPAAPWLAIGADQMAGRLLSAAAGAGTAWVVFLLLWRRIGRFGAGLGAAAMALAPGHVLHSQFQTVDVLGAFWVALSLLFAARFADGVDEGKRDALWAGLFAGLAAGTKYTGILALLALAAAAAGARREPGAWRQAGIGALAAFAAFALATPGAWLNSAAFLRDFRYEMAHTSEGHGLVFAGTSPGFLYHLANLSAGWGVAGLIVAGVGLAWAARERAKWVWPLLAFGVAYYVLIGRAEVKFLRYTLPLFPVLAAGLGFAVDRAHRAQKQAWKLLVAAGIVAVGGALSSTAKQATWTAGADPRVEAARDLRGSVSVGLVADPWFYTPTLYPQTALPRSVPFSERDRLMREASSPRVLRFVPENPDERFDWDVRLLDLKPEAVAFSSFEADDLHRLRTAKGLAPEVQVQVDRYVAFLARITQEYEPLESYGTDGPAIHDLMYVRPRIWTWKRKVP